MAVPEYRDEVLITLSSVNPPPDFTFKKRHVFLTKKNPTIQIGRTSKRKSCLEAGKFNAWFDSAVMSRKHALLVFDAENQKVYIMDTDSLHGTYKNDILLKLNEKAEISTGDKLMFGTSIDRGTEKYPPTTLEITLKYGSMDPAHRGNCFRVPDDFEDMSSDEDQVQNSCKMLHAKKVRPAAPGASLLDDSPIDLTCDEDRSLLPSPHAAPQPPPALKERTTSNDDFTPSKDVGFWTDEDEEGEMYDGEDEEMGEDSHVDQSTFKGTDDDFPVAHSQSSSDMEVDDRYDSESAEDGFDDQDEFEEGMLARPDYLTYLDRSPENTIGPATPANNNAKATGDISAQASCANSGTPKQQKINVIGEETTKDLNPPAFGKPLGLKPNHSKTNDFWKLPQQFLPTPGPLPSIAELTKNQSHYTTDTPKDVVETMGRKTGKLEFFAAREANKVLNAGAKLPWSLPHISAIPPDHTQQLNELLSNLQSLQGDRVVVPLPSSGLTSPRARFLETTQGPFHQVEPETVNAEFALDGSTAFDLEHSKKPSAVDEPVADTLAHPMTTQNDDEEVCTLQDAAQAPTTSENTASESNKDEAAKVTDEPTKTTKSSKRKAEEISELVAEEELIESSEPPLITQRAACLSPRRAARSRPSPPKRLRRMAEVVGYATLGGVAVMSALIATAPAL
ncbi:hypothetical protein HYE67_011049 [Fusarium culmorum]|uniref:FHA domain-containing protein n=1 Tax=Fusarium culmorum TaxID=5516 RepID=A0A7S8DHQ9_FUSCU|nr:hypothetical protein HYE67_011049 [Fusarium culmorum]